jgi:hypothetical protein
MKSKKEQLALLKETVDFYSEDVSRRSLQAGKGCMYLSDTGNMCAVGRCLKDPSGAIEGDNISQFDNLDEQLKDEYKDYPIKLWKKLQMLHDEPNYWTSKVLSPYGKNYVKYIEDKINLGFPLVRFSSEAV